MCIATRCTSVEQFIEMFHRFVDEDSFFVSTMNTRPPGLETSFQVQLANGTPVLRGLCVVLQAWTTTASPFKTPGVRLGIKRLTANSMPVFERLLVTRSRPAPPPAPPAALGAGTQVPRPIDAHTSEPTTVDGSRFSDTGPTRLAPKPPPVPRSGTPAPTPTTPAPAPTTAPTAETTTESETRTPGSELVLPANPLMNLSDASLEGYVDCTLYEETGSFFPVDEHGNPTDDGVPLVAPPVLAPRPVARVATPVELVADEPPPGEAPADELSFDELVPATSIAAPVAADAASASRPSISRFSSRESTPAGEMSPLARALPRMSPRRWAIVGGGALLALLVVWIAASSSDSSARPVAKTATGASEAGATPSDVTPEPAPAVAEAGDAPDDDGAPADGADDTPTDADAKTGDDPIVEAAPERAGPPRVGDGPCSVEVVSTPAGSQVLLDGKPMAPSPVTLATTCERHEVAIKHPRYKMASRVVTLSPDAPGSVDIRLQRPTHAVSVTSRPAGATVYIDGRRAGTTPTVLNVLGFERLKLEIKKTGYAPVRTKLYSKVPKDKVAVKLMRW